MKQVLLIGDSIRMGYCGYVKEALADKAEVIYPEENCRSSQHILMNLGAWAKMCNKESVEVVHFNCGHWDAERFNGDIEPLTSVEEYEKNLRKIVRVLRSFFPNAKLICATTTPMNPANRPGDCNRTTEELHLYNKSAMAVMQEMEVEVNDLFTAAIFWGAERFVDYCHMADVGYRALGARVAERVARYL